MILNKYVLKGGLVGFGIALIILFVNGGSYMSSSMVFNIFLPVAVLLYVIYGNDTVHNYQNPQPLFYPFTLAYAIMLGCLIGWIIFKVRNGKAR